MSVSTLHRPVQIAARRLACLACLAACFGCRTLSPTAATSSIATSRQLAQQATSAMDRGDWKRAETLAARAVEACPADVESRRNYAETLSHRGAISEALIQLEEARRVAGEDPALAVKTGELKLRVGDTGSAARLADEALAIDPKFAPAWALRGRVAAASGQTRQALADYQRSLGLAPDEVDVSIAIAEAYRQMNEPERALVALQAVSDRYARGAEPQRVLHLEGLTLLSLARYEQASAVLRRAVERDRPSAELMCHLGEAQLLAGRVGEAQDTVQRALALDPSHPASRTLSMRLAMASSGNPTR